MIAEIVLNPQDEDPVTRIEVKSKLWNPYEEDFDPELHWNTFIVSLIQNARGTDEVLWEKEVKV